MEVVIIYDSICSICVLYVNISALI